MEAVGMYKIMEKKYNNFPAWKKQGKNWYINVDSSGRWSIGNGLNSGRQPVFANLKRNPTPLSVWTLTGWRYKKGRNPWWKTDKLGDFSIKSGMIGYTPTKSERTV